MALKIDTTDSKGVKTNYHRIVGINIVSESVSISVASYVSKEYRDAEKETEYNNFVVSEKVYDFPFEKEDTISLSYLYGMLKTCEEFKDSEDC